MIIRDYASPDYGQVMTLWEEADIYLAEQEEIPTLIEHCTLLGGKLLLMEDPETSQIMGTSWLTWDGRRVMMHHFAVRKEHRRKGYGRQLALASMAFAKEKNAPLNLEVHRDNSAAIKLYESLGLTGFADYLVYES